MALEANPRIGRFSQSEIRAMTTACARANGVNMAQGVCDTPVPEVVLRRAQEAIERGSNMYSRLDGIPELRRALSRKLSQYNGITADPETEITVSAGATGAFHCACMALLNPGDEVILFEPYYAYHISALLAVEATPVIVPTHPPDWAVPIDVLEGAVTSRTKAIIINSPANPSGKVFTKTEFQSVALVAQRHDLFVFTDEIYEYFLYEGRRHISLAASRDMTSRTITIGGYSKTFSITGWRIGYVVADRRWSELIGAANDLLYVCAPTPLQYGVAAGIDELDSSFYNELACDYETKRNQFCEALAKAGLTPCVPEGAYYVLADVSRLPGGTGKERALYLLDKTGIAGVPGEAFFQGATGNRFIRLCFAKTDQHLSEACERLKRLP